MKYWSMPAMYLKWGIYLMCWRCYQGISLSIAKLCEKYNLDGLLGMANTGDLFVVVLLILNFHTKALCHGIYDGIS